MHVRRFAPGLERETDAPSETGGLLIAFRTSLLMLLAFLLTLWSINAVAFAQTGGQAGDLSDTDISQAVDIELILDDEVNAQAVDVSVTKGVVTLSGTVDSLLAKERAIQVAEATKGVRAIVDQLTVRPTDKSDAKIRDDVEWALLNDSATESYEIDVAVTDGTVTLTGTVDSWQEKQLAETVASGVSGVRRVHNEVGLSPTDTRPDAEIVSEIERRLETSVWIDEGLVDVSVTNGEVTLSGTVGSTAEKQRAYAKAWVAGVSGVNADNLEVEWWARDRMRREDKFANKTDAEIERAVQDALLYDPRVTSFNIGVDADLGSVTLTGTVDNLQAKRAAERDARNAVGVYRVKNLIKVRPGTEFGDAEIAEDLRQTFRLDPIIEPGEVSVTVDNGVADLYGTVDSYYEKQWAGDLAARQPGIIAVDNNLATDTWEWKADWELKQDVQDQFFWSLFVDGEDIDVEVEDGVVTLEGNVDTWSEYQNAIENAYEAGAKKVVSKLEVAYGPPFTTPYYGPYDHWPYY